MIEPPSPGELAVVFPTLSFRECEVASEMATGGDVATIASALNMRLNTVRSHLKTIYAKLGVHSRTEAVAVIYRTVVHRTYVVSERASD